jgi:hypothetical protein
LLAPLSEIGKGRYFRQIGPHLEVKRLTWDRRPFAQSNALRRFCAPPGSQISAKPVLASNQTCSDESSISRNNPVRLFGNKQINDKTGILTTCANQTKKWAFDCAIWRISKKNKKRDCNAYSKCYNQIIRYLMTRSLKGIRDFTLRRLNATQYGKRVFAPRGQASQETCKRSSLGF